MAFQIDGFKSYTRLAALLTIAALCVPQAQAATPKGFVAQDNGEDLVPTGKGWGEKPVTGRELNNFPGQKGIARGGAKPGGSSSNGINFHGGPVITAPATIYFIWYGNWTNNSAQQILSDFAANIGGSPYFNINTTYYDGSGAKVLNVAGQSPVLHGLQASVTGNYSTSLSDADVQKIVSDSIGPNLLPADPNGVYFVLTSSDVRETSGFCTKYCGWHTHASIGGKDIKYSFVGNPDQCPSACEAQTTGPNGNAGADGMASIIAHELEEAVTDPDLNAWFDRRGYENADKCAWTFGTTYKTSNGAQANMMLGSRNYLIQRNWVNAGGGYCSVAYP